jgi:hypothetical protein
MTMYTLSLDDNTFSDVIIVASKDFIANRFLESDPFNITFQALLHFDR